jgi:hypothetical protein
MIDTTWPMGVSTGKIEGVRHFQSESEVPSNAHRVSNWSVVGRAPSQYSELHVDAGIVFWIDPRTIEDQRASRWAEVRSARDALLSASDWVPVRALEQGRQFSVAWQAYRQALRDVTTQTDPFNVIWPQAPTSFDAP